MQRYTDHHRREKYTDGNLLEQLGAWTIIAGGMLVILLLI
jgi:hypothetical protein